MGLKKDIFNKVSDLLTRFRETDVFGTSLEENTLQSTIKDVEVKEVIIMIVGSYGGVWG